MTASREFATLVGEWARLSIRSEMGGFFHYAKEMGLSPMHLGALMRISRGGTRKVASLGGDFGVTSAASSQMLDRLVSMGLVTRTEDPDDRRAKRVALTELGESAVAKGVEARAGWVERVAAQMTKKELEAAAAGLKLLVEKARQVEAEEGRGR
jgi:DNA-binding MarR family transcriptional regulator